MPKPLKKTIMKNKFSLAAVALCSVALFSACETDNDSNPTLVAPSTFVVNTPEFTNQTVVLGETDNVTLTWNQPVFTDLGAPIGANGTSGIKYYVQVSDGDHFNKSYAAAVAEAGEEGTPAGYDFVQLDDAFTSTTAGVSCAAVNRALNQLKAATDAPWTEDTAIPVTTTYVRVKAVISDAAGREFASAISNTVTFTTQPSWVDLNKGGAAAYMWVPGNGNGWNHGVCPVLVSENNDGIYVGYAYMDGDFKFTMVPEWGEERNNGSFSSASDCIDLGDQGGGNISYTGEASMCYIVVDDNTKTLSVTPCTWGVVGNFNGWSVAAGEIVAMSYNKDAHCLETPVTFDADAEWKFARDNSWDVNFGGAFDNLQQDGPNFATGAGSYTIQLFIERANDGYSAKVD